MTEIIENEINELLSRPADAIVVLSGGIKKILPGQIIASGDITNNLDEKSVRFNSTGFSDPDPRNSLGWGKSKVLTAVALLQNFSNRFPDNMPTIVTMSRSTNNKTALSDAEVEKEELCRQGINEDRIITHEYSIDTFTELLETVRLAVEHKWERVVFCTTTYQKPRAETMLQSILSISNEQELHKVEQILAFNANRFNRTTHPDRIGDHERFKETLRFLQENVSLLASLQPVFVEAENILPLRSHSHKHVVELATQEPRYAEKLTQDQGAAEQWRKGDYGKVTDDIIERWKNGDLP